MNKSQHCEGKEMGTRSSLQLEVATKKLNKQLADNPATFFGQSALVFHRRGACDWADEPQERESECAKDGCLPAATCREMLEVLRDYFTAPQSAYLVLGQGQPDYDITDPDALARACIEANKAAR